MIVVSVALVVSLIALIVIVRLLTEAHSKAEAQWAEERRELINRVQAPERVPIVPPPSWLTPDAEMDEFAQVGTIRIDEEYGTDDFYGSPELP